jgi:hypothetical protein
MSPLIDDSESSQRCASFGSSEYYTDTNIRGDLIINLSVMEFWQSSSSRVTIVAIMTNIAALSVFELCRF